MQDLLYKKKFDKIKKIWYESENAEMKTKIKCDKWYKDCIGEVSYSQPNFSSDTCLFNICTSHKKKKCNNNSYFGC